MTENHNNDFGKKINDEVKRVLNETINSRSFDELKGTVDSVIREVKSCVSPGGKYQPPKNHAYSQTSSQPASQNGSRQAVSQQQKLRQLYSRLPKAGGVMTGIGIGGIVLAGLNFLPLVVRLISNPTGAVGSLAVFGFFLAVGGGFLAAGLTLMGRNSRFKKYLKELLPEEFCLIDQLCSVVGQSKKVVLRELKKLMKLRLLPEARFDEEKTVIMLNEQTYQHYLHTQEVQREMEKKFASVDPETAEMLREGRAYISKINQLNAQIPGQEISKKISLLENVTAKIITCVEDQPEKLPEIRKFMSYYLPTTLKLLGAYQNFDSQPVGGENIEAAKKDIEDALDTVNLAFQNLLDDLFEHERMDIASDISVLETMLKQEGLAENDFEQKEETQ